MIVPLDISDACLADLRAPDVQRLLGLAGHESSTPWQPERAKGLLATSWLASDAARHAGGDGIIYPARSDVTRYHIVLFQWNGATGPRVQQNGSPIAF